MEASSTTLNISPETPVDNHGHNHKYPNFGRFVEGCAACEAKGRPAQKAKAEKAVTPAPAVSAPGENAALAQLLQLLIQKEAKTALKEEGDEQRRLQAREDMIRVTAEQQAMIDNMQANCGWEHGRPGSHTKENGRTAVNGQVHNDGLYHPFCQRCFKTFPPVSPRADQMPTGVTIA